MTALIILSTACFAALIGWTIGRRRSLPLLRPGTVITFRDDLGRTVSKAALSSWTRTLNEGDRIELVSLDRLMSERGPRTRGDR